MTLQLATEGCCTGHKCDNCATCRKGRCCRRDDPDYKLPTPDEWGLPIHGNVGVLATDRETIQCHICGAWFIGLNHHAWNAHNMFAREYKSYFGLNLNTPLVSPEVSAKLRANGELLYERFGVPPELHRTPEQCSHGSARSRSKQFAAQQHQKTRANRSGYIGVKASGKRWVASINHDHTFIYLGTYVSAEAAARAHDRKARELYGDAARLNFPD